MARNDDLFSDQADTDTLTEAPVEVTETVEVVQPDPETVAPASDPAAEAKAEAEALAHQSTVDAFTALADQAIENSDPETGTVSEADLDAVSNAYQAITGGIKFKNAAKNHVNEAIKTNLGSGVSGYPKAAAANEVNERILTAVSKGKSGGDKAPKVVVSPAQVYADKVTVLRLALSLAEETAPAEAEGWDALADDFDDTAVGPEVKAYQAWRAEDEEVRGDEPELSNISRAVLKVLDGKSPTKARGGSGSTGPTYAGPRRSVEAHILNAFANVASGDFLTVAEIRAVKSDEYGDDAPSAGAVSARLFPKSGKVSIEGVIPGENDKGVNGAFKA